MLPRRIAQFWRNVMAPGLWEGPADRRWVSLTFDDGPDPVMTTRILDALKAVRAPAAFFLVGRRARRHPELVCRIASEGHEVGNHTWSHRPLLAGASPDRQLSRTEEVLSRLCPGSPRIFRPPFGAIGPNGPAALRRHGLTPVYWSIVPGDWDPTHPDQLRRRVLRQLHPGAVIVLHAGRPWHAGTAAAVGPLVRDLRDRDYEIVPISRMLAAGGHPVGVR